MKGNFLVSLKKKKKDISEWGMSSLFARHKQKNGACRPDADDTILPSLTVSFYFKTGKKSLKSQKI